MDLYEKKKIILSLKLYLSLLFYFILASEKGVCGFRGSTTLVTNLNVCFFSLKINSTYYKHIFIIIVLIKKEIGSKPQIRRITFDHDILSSKYSFSPRGRFVSGRQA